MFTIIIVQRNYGEIYLYILEQKVWFKKFGNLINGIHS